MKRNRERDLDGPECEFPHRYEAMRAIRALWGGWLVARDPLDRDILAYAIDEERLRMCRGSGPLWEAFADTLPGYRDYQGHMVATMFADLFPSD
ncbi:MAG: hypothetical protein EBT79_02465 [Actinobacteria bacterium]|nr:hypothetical protein [Actinomycetota bacterium]NBR66139.1 hypothetical protein [Actinomycetota bacterium]